MHPANASRPPLAGRRATNIDVCRGLLFAMMANTHSLYLAGVASTHFLFSDLWLPGGWATQVFVVLSGFSVGFLCGSRNDVGAVERALVRRSKQIILVMVVSNSASATLREIAGGHAGRLADPAWWFGFLSLDTDWTISGVLMPTALVVLFGVYICRLVRANPWQMLGVLITARILVSLAAATLPHTAYGNLWPARFLLLEGFGGFPILPFVINGFLGVWLGMLRNSNHKTWRVAMCVLMLAQLPVYLSSFATPSLASAMLVGSCSALGKFAWMYMIAHALTLAGPLLFSGPVELIGKFALGSFVMHRAFLHLLTGVVGKFGGAGLAPELRYAAILCGTLLLTWLLCFLRERVDWIDLPLRRLAM